MATDPDKLVNSRMHRCDQRLAELYARAFSEFGVRALWNMQKLNEPSVADVLATARQLRHEGDLSARRLAEEMEQAACAYL